MNHEQPLTKTAQTGGLAVRTNLRAGTSRDEFVAQIKAYFQQMMNNQTDTTTTATTDTTTTTA